MTPEETLRQALLEDKFPESDEKPIIPIADPLKYNRMTAVSAWMGNLTGQDISPEDIGWQAEKDALAQSFFKMPDAKDVSDETVHDLIRSHIQTSDNATDIALNSALTGRPLAQTLNEIQALAGVSKTRGIRDRYVSAASSLYSDIAAKRNVYSDVINKVSGSLGEMLKKTDTDIGMTDVFNDAAERLMGVPAEDRRLVIEAIAATGNATAEERSSYLSKVEWRVNRMAETLGAASVSNLSNALESVLDLAAFGSGLADPRDVAGAAPEGNKSRELSLLAQQIRTAANEKLDPIKSNSWIGKQGLALADMATQSGVALVNPLAGFAVNLAYFNDTMGADAMTQNPGLTVEQADKITAIGAPVNAAIETITALIPFGKVKLPFVQKWLMAETASVGGVLRKFGIRATTGTATEIGEEIAQAYVPLKVQELMRVMGQDMPAVDWERNMPKFADIAAEVWAPALVFSIVGAGAASINDINNGRSLASDLDLLIARGIAPETAAKIKDASDLGDYNKVDSLFREEFVSETKASKPDIQAATERLKARFRDQSSIDVLQDATSPEYTAKVIRTATGWQVQTGDGNVITTETKEAADQIYSKIRQVGNQKEAEVMAEILDGFYSGGMGRGAQVEMTGETVGAAGNVVSAIRRDAGGAPIAGSARIFDERALEEVRAEAAAAGFASGTQEVFARINGSNEVFPQQVGDTAKGIWRILSLFESRKNATPQVATLLHEDIESKFTLGLINKSWTVSDIQKAFAALLPAFANITAPIVQTDEQIAKMSKSAQEAYYAKQSEFNWINNVRNIVDGKFDAATLRETFSEMYVRDRFALDRKGLPTGLPAGLISRGIEASIMGATTQEEAGIYKRFRAMFKAFSAHFKAVFKTVQTMVAARKEGKIGEDWDSFVNKVLGIDEVKQMESQTVDEVKAMLGIDEEVQAVIDAGNMAFSTSRAQPADTSNVTEMPDGAQLVGPTTFSIEAYHGTPHEVDRFLTSKIGTGEGAQAFGWGLYFAKARKVAEGYRSKLTERDFIRKVREVFSEFDTPQDAIDALDDLDLSDGQRNLVKALEADDWLGFEYPHQAVQAALREPENFDLSQESLNALASFGNLYTVELLPDEEDFLDWDKPLSEQSEKVKGILSKLLPSYEMAQEIDAEDNRLADIYNADPSMDNEFAFTNHHQSREQRLAKLVLRERNPNLYGKFANGVDIYGAFGGSLGGLNSKSTSEYFASLGIPGIRYLDGGSRAAGEGTSNYVIFDENLVKIIEKNGQKVDASSPTFSLSKAGFNHVYLKNEAKFKDAVAKGIAKEKVPISTFDGKTILFHQPDFAFSGVIFYKGEILIEGKGGIYYPILFTEEGYFWACTRDKAIEMAASLNKISKLNGGKIYLGLTSAPIEKMFSSTTMSTGVMNFLVKLSNSPKKFGITRDELNAMIVEASAVQIVKKGADPKKFDIKLSVKKGLKDNVETMKKSLGPDESAFPVRKAFVESLAKQLAAHLSVEEKNSQRMEFAKLLAGKDNKFAKGPILKGTLSMAAIMQGFGDMLSEPALKTFQQFDKGGQLYAVIEVEGEVEAFESDLHDSYPFAIRSTTGKQATVNVLEKAYSWTDVAVFRDTKLPMPNDEKTLSSIYPPSAGVSMYKERGHLEIKAPAASVPGINLSFSISPAQDAEYLAAAKAGDTETAQRLVDASAKAVGATNRLQHWTNSDTFTRFDPAKINAGQGFTGTQVNGFWFNDANGTRSPFGSKKIDAFLILKNPKVFESAEDFDAATETFDSSEEFTSNLVSQGHDGVIIKPAEEWMGSQEWEFTNYVAFSPNQIKSADPVTYDADGNIIPLSQRFNEATPDIRFSISPVRNLNELSDQVEKQFAENPVEALEVKSRMIRQFAKISDKWSNERWTPQGNKIRPISEKRTVKSLDKEQAMRQAQREVELVNEGIDKLTPNTLMAYSEGVGVIQDDPLVARMLNDNGKLMSKSTAAREGRNIKDQYDDAGWIPPQWYAKAGGIMPDVMANNLGFDTASEMWAALDSSIKSHRNAKEDYAKAEAAVKAVEKAALEQAKAEAQAWRDETDAMQKEDWSPKESLVRDLITLEAIRAMFPQEIRDKIGGFVALARKASEAARLKVLQKQLERGQVLLEKHLKEQYGTATEELLKRFKSQKDASGRITGKIISTATEQVDYAAEFIKLSIEEQADRQAALEKKVEESENANEVQDALTKLGIARLFDMWSDKDSAARESAFNWLNDTIEAGKLGKSIMDEARKEMLTEMRQSAQSSILQGDELNPDIADNITNLNKGVFKRALLNLRGMLSEALWTTIQRLELIFGEDSKIVNHFAEKIINAANLSTDIKRLIEAQKKDALSIIFNTDSKYAHARGIAELQKMKKSGISTRRVKKEEIKLDLETLTKLNDGTMTAEAAGLRQDEANAALKEFANNGRKSTVTIERVVNAGTPVERMMSETQGIQWWLWSMQDASRKQMERDGWDADSFKQLEEFLSPEAKALGRWISGSYQDAAGMIDPIYRKLFNAPLPRTKNYSPIHRRNMNTGGDVMDIDGSDMNSGLAAGFTKARVNTTASLVEMDALAVFLAHWENVSHWVSHAELMRDMKAVLLDKDTAVAIRQKKSEGYLQRLKDDVKTIEKNGTNSASELVNISRVWRWFMQYRSYKGLAFRLSPIIKQTPALLNPLLADVPTHNYMMGMARAFIEPQTFAKEVSAMWSSDIIRRRIESGFSAESRVAMQGAGMTGSQAIVAMQAGMVPMGMVDGGWTALGAAISFDYYRRGYMRDNPQMTPEIADAKAIARVEKMIATSAQPSDVYARSLSERSGNPFMKSMSMFVSDQRKALAIELMAIRRLATGKSKNVTLDIQRAVVAHVVQAGVSQVMAVVIASLLGDDEDRDRELSSEQWALALGLGPVNGLFVFGRLIDKVGRGLLGLRVFPADDLASKVANDLLKGGKNMDDLFNPDDADDFMDALDSSSTALGAGMSAAIGPAGGVIDVGANVAREARKIAKRLADQ